DRTFSSKAERRFSTASNIFDFASNSDAMLFSTISLITNSSAAPKTSNTTTAGEYLASHSKSSVMYPPTLYHARVKPFLTIHSISATLSRQKDDCERQVLTYNLRDASN